MTDLLSEHLPESLMADLRRRHAEPHRAYHDWSHIAALLTLHRELANSFADPVAVLLAVLFHDAIYDPRAADNEEQSARLLEEQLTGRVAEGTLRRAAALVRATRAHAVPDGLAAPEAADMALFLDMDLAILGAGAEAFDAYERGVRREYAHVPDEAFRAGRAAVLERFTQRERLYFSEWGRARFEAAARANLARSLAALRSD